MYAVTAPDDARRTLAAQYLRGRTLEEALAAWRSDHARQPYWKRCPTLTRLGNVIRQFAAEAEAEARDEVAGDLPQMRRSGLTRGGRTGRR